MKLYGFWAFQIGVLLIVLALSAVSFRVVETSRTLQTEVLAARDETVVLLQDDNAPDPLHVHKIVNEHRKQTLQKELIISQRLAEAAKRRAIDMQQARYYAHESPINNTTFVDTLRSLNYAYAFACENLNLTFSSNAYATVDDWMSSPAHKNCLMHESISSVGYASISLPTSDDQPIAYVVVAIYATEVI